MSKPVITVENLSKSYLIRHQQTEGGYMALRDVITDKVKSLFKPKKNNNTTKELFWALKDVSFEVNQGDRIGIIGRNGAGKSTLLKILSRIVSPTKGKITIEGRVASLLEVGTGFHPELTGRENIFLNGSILGMNKADIKNKFDEIVDFSGVGQFLDTPVKRYSSGMYVRLAFAVAAHLDPEILIIDEVLAVGDAEFQKKCLRKMKDASTIGRTILFVSHNMASIGTLCNYGLMLENGNIKSKGNIKEIILSYTKPLENVMQDSNNIYIAKENDLLDGQIMTIKVIDIEGNLRSQFDVWDEIYVELCFKINKTNLALVTPILKIEKDGVELFWSFASDTNPGLLTGLKKGKYLYKVKLPCPLKKGQYSITVNLGRPRIGNIDTIIHAVKFDVEEFSFDPTNVSYADSRGGIVPAILDWKLLEANDL